MSTASYLGFDYGRSRIGVAVGQRLTGIANGLTTLAANHGQPDWSQVEKLIAEWRPSALIVGMPRNMNGSEHELSAEVKKFANRLHGRFGLPVYEVDERLSSAEAARAYSGKLNRNNKAVLDKIAAQLILQTWLDQQS